MVTLLAAISLAAGAAVPTVTLEEVASTLSQPLAITHAADGSGRLFVVEKPGRIRIVKDGALLPTPFLDIAARVSTSGERGLLGLAFHPRFRSNRRFFVFYTMLPDDTTGGALRIASFTANAGAPDTADPASEREVITIPHPGFSNHNGGTLAFGPDGYLYAGVGDGGSGGDPSNHGQSLATLQGKLLRLDVTPATGYAIPPGNPFAGVAGARPEVWAYGLRNPWKFSFDRETGDLYIGDVGQGTMEEIDFLPHGARAGANFGWRVFEGTGCFDPPSDCSLPNHTPPVITYLRDWAGGRSVTGGYVYRGQGSAALRGYYVYGDFVSSRVWAARREAGTWVTEVLIPPPGILSGVSSFGEDERGELYVASLGTGTVHRIVGPAPGASPTVVQAHPLDFDGDGRHDLLWRRTSDGLMGPWLMDGAATPTWSAFKGPGGSIVHRAADFDGDGKTDLLWRASGNYWLSTMDGLAIVSTTPIFTATGGWEVIGHGDFDGNGKVDLLWRSAAGVHGVWLMDGAIALQKAAIESPGPGWNVVAVGDFDGDGKADLAWRDAANGFEVRLMDGATATATGAFTVPFAWTLSHVADFDGDGKSDIAWQRSDQLLGLWRMDGVTQASATAFFGPPGSTLAQAADFDGDGDADLLWRGMNGSFHVSLLEAGEVVSTTATFPGDNNWLVIGHGDYDGDGKSDLLWRAGADNSYGTWIMDGASAVTKTLVIAPGTAWAPAP